MIPSPSTAESEGRLWAPITGEFSDATVSFLQQSESSITDAYPVQVKTDLRGQFDTGATLKHGIYDVYARSEKNDYPDKALAFYRSTDFHPERVQLFGAQVLSISGIVLWWPSKMFRIRRGPPLRFTFELRNTLGIVSSVFLLLFAWTAICIHWERKVNESAQRVSPKVSTSAHCRPLQADA